MNFLQTPRMSWARVAENIMTCLSCGVILKISCTSARMSSFSNTLSHSSRMKCLTVFRFRMPSLASCLMRPGVPTTIAGTSFFRDSFCCCTGMPPKKLPTLTLRSRVLKRSNSWQIWYASSRVWHSTMADTSPGLGSSCCSTDSTNTAVLPIPDLAWHSTSMPRMAWGMHSCWTSEGCSKPQSVMACRSSGFSMSSLKPVAWMPT
mmetsp:Transcript_19152/g.53631  ORF Transcript_19152/g.53631 Transcript_19152/m.53631 type:complete len:205 (-) Transcript_19152:213-827(-)